MLVCPCDLPQAATCPQGGFCHPLSSGSCHVYIAHGMTSSACAASLAARHYVLHSMQSQNFHHLFWAVVRMMENRP